MVNRMFSHGGLRLYLLGLLDEEPRHGYDLIRALSDRTGGTYTPSAGTIYPRLARLEEDGLVTTSVDGRKTIYAITDAGRAEVAARRGELDGIDDGLSDNVRVIADEVRGVVHEAMRSLQADLASAARAERTSARKGHSDARAASRFELQRADAALSTFRSRVRSDLREFVARGGVLRGDVIDRLTDALDHASHEVTRSLTEHPSGYPA